MYKKINQCRVCGNRNLIQVLDLGEQMLTGVFPNEPDADVTIGPLRLVKCTGEKTCGLLQMDGSYDLGEMYGENYGYRSGLNDSMVTHLHNKVRKICKTVDIKHGDLVVDIGSNDSTTLQAYKVDGVDLVGIDPTGIKFHAYYPEHIQLISEFFSADLIQEYFPGRKAKVITSFSMFYDLENPMSFMQDVYNVLEEDGIWVFEQSYMPTMLEMNSYDTVCHEHLEYYALHQIKWMTDRVGFRIIDVHFNDVNGGSFSVSVSKSNPSLPPPKEVLSILEKERNLGIHTLTPYQEFARRVANTKEQLRSFFDKAKIEKKSVMALGASTKGNVVLQYCNVTTSDIAFVGEVNTEKFDCFTPGTWLPIIDESEIIKKSPDYLIILPWHFKEFFLSSDKFKDILLVTPLPQVDILN